MKPCPSCGRRVQDAAVKCHYCGANVRAPRTDAPAPKPPAAARPQVTKGARATGTIIVVLIVVALTIWWLS